MSVEDLSGFCPGAALEPLLLSTSLPEWFAHAANQIAQGRLQPSMFPSLMLHFTF